MKTTLKLHPMHPKTEQTDSQSATISNDSSKMAETYGFAGAKKPAQGPVSGSFLPETTTTQATGTAPVTAEVKTTVYTADLGDRTEGNQNWSETGGDLGSRTTQGTSEMAQKAKVVGQQAADSAKQTASNVADSAYNAKETVKDKAANLKESADQTAAQTSASMQSKWEQGKEKLGQVAETAKEKAYHASEVAGEKYQQTKVAAEHNLEAGKERLGQTYDATLHKTQDATQSVKEGTHGLMDRVKETFGSTSHSIQETAGNTASAIQQTSHNLVEQAQHTLEAAREKAREVFAGAQQDMPTTTTSKDTMYVKPGETAIGGTPTVDVKVKTTDTTGDVDRVKVQTTTTQ
jgi:ElaB/YqjD/DUF883 family membrane-anchored ribosome-binding protein